MMNLKEIIRDIPDFPQPGILFKDITTLLNNPVALRETIEQLLALCEGKEIDLVAAVESRGFIFGMPLAYELGCGFIPVRKPGRLPAETIRESYALEYGTNTLEMHTDAIQAGQKVLVVDDLLATGGTAQATCRLVDQLGGEVVGVLFVIELAFLKGRSALTGRDISSLVIFD